MKALVYTEPCKVVYRDEPDPLPKAGEGLVKIDAVGICGSDMHAFQGHDSRRPPPLILGHEASGTVVTGAGAEGRQVVINPLVSCGRCDACLSGRNNLCAKREIISMHPRPGAFAELIAVPLSSLVEVPDGMDPAVAALAEPIATALHGVALAPVVAA